LWKSLCERHSILLDITCEEYSALLESNLETLDSLLERKTSQIEKINELDKYRQSLIDQVNTYINSEGEKISSISDFIMFFDRFEKSNNQKHLFRFNELLIDIIEKIQQQNKKNQLFLNKAILSLKDLREEALGVKSYMTYTSKGFTT
jgi:flagellar biosynthesis/type III secretory pathway chaperone